MILPVRRNYLRVRGEYQTETGKRLWGEELPPRARRIQNFLKKTFKKHGTTSACAENTVVGGGHPESVRNYLRVRGEY